MKLGRNSKYDKIRRIKKGKKGRKKMGEKKTGYGKNLNEK